METTSFTTERASFGTRFIAALVDGILVGIVNVIIARVTGIPFVGFLISFGYYTYLEGGETGQTFGKRVMGIRVADKTTGASIGYGRAMVRWIGRLVSGIALGLGYLWMLWDDESQTWHDKMAECLVVPVSAAP